MDKYFYGELGVDFGVKDLIGVEGDLRIHINSIGGDAYGGLAIYNILKMYSGAVEIVIEGLCASAATLIICASDNVKMAANGLLMLHNPSAGLNGYFESEELSKVQGGLEVLTNVIINIYQRKTGKSRGELEELMNAESWLDAAAANALGFVDEIIGGVKVDEKLMSKYKDSVIAAERGRIKKLSALKNGVAAVEALIDTAIELGKEPEEIEPYISAVNKVETTGRAELTALIKEQMTSGAEGVEASIPTDKNQERAAALARQLKNMAGGKNG